MIPYDGPIPSNLELKGEERERYFIIDGTFTLAPAERKQAIITYLNDMYHYNFKPAHGTVFFSSHSITIINLTAARFIQGKNIKIPAYRLVLALKACQVDGTLPHFNLELKHCLEIKVLQVNQKQRILRAFDFSYMEHVRSFLMVFFFFFYVVIRSKESPSLTSLFSTVSRSATCTTIFSMLLNCTIVPIFKQYVAFVA